ncbi:hypothetical protein [Pontivivens nitratireducens]|uniref:Cyclic GMP-AMP synthase C-terminal domain-containing protein n=1 Tax=Pontivivens nitratireducens TaxID=2758038 RepID=A0A6G7VKT2_9RHOB|nr:hypothetical protein [Pontibrevibacter nitratireducens]QIK40510.1 hypothetical protein G8E03_06865 [Pontibrevibacter nitratireducens]
MDFTAELRIEDTAYRMLSHDEMMLAHRNEGWMKSDPRKLEDWFVDAVKQYGEQVRTVSRYLKGWKDFQWPKGRLASITLMAAVVSVFEKTSAAIASDRDDLALLRVAQDLPWCILPLPAGHRAQSLEPQRVNMGRYQRSYSIDRSFIRRRVYQ